ncbi:MAG: tetratricopeptide repeat protein, partial [Chitinophagaceae bacterium]|nr:tetratricopeptide repeat protein [Oligoflexus sp.]
VTTVIPKPCTRADLIKQVIWTVQQEHAPTDQPAIERKIRKAIAAKDWNAVETLSSKFLANPAISSGAKDLIQAEVSYGRGKFEDARGFALSSFKNAGDSIFVLNLLGKIMMQLNEPATALKCFQKAQDLAPQNLERLCQIAEIQADLEDHEKSLATQAEVENLDPTSEKLKETKAKIALKSGDEEGAKSIMGSIRAVENVVSYMNNLAVAMARCGQIAEGIEQYRKTIRSLPVDRLDLIAVVEYNLALAFLRSNDFKQALAHLERATSNPNSKIQKKALSLIRRLHSAEAQGIVFSLQTDKETLPLQNTESANKNEVVYNSGGSEKSRVLDDLAAVVENRPGENCCVSIYHATRQPPSVSSMLEGNLKFVSESTIHKVVLAVGDKI